MANQLICPFCSWSTMKFRRSASGKTNVSGMPDLNRHVRDSHFDLDQAVKTRELVKLEANTAENYDRDESPDGIHLSDEFTDEFEGDPRDPNGGPFPLDKFFR